MRGSLDNPPIIIQQNRLRPLLFLFGLLTLIAIIATGLWDGMVERGGYVLLAFFILCMVVIAWWLIHPASITIDRDGLVHRTSLRVFRYEWKDFSRFRVIPGFWTGRAYFPSMLCGELDENYRAQGSNRRGGSRVFFGFWELELSDLANLLNTARDQWN